MPRPADKPTRRAFLGNTLKLGAGSLLVGATLRGSAEAITPGPTASSPMITELPGLPSRVFIDHDGTGPVAADRQGSRFSSGQA
jgi:hypothetical protein